MVYFRMFQMHSPDSRTVPDPGSAPETEPRHTSDGSSLLPQTLHTARLPARVHVQTGTRVTFTCV